MKNAALLAALVALALSGCGGGSGGGSGSSGTTNGGTPPAPPSPPPPPEAIAIEPASLPNAQFGVPYTASLSVNGAAPIAWSVVGDLPPGIVLGSRTGQ